MEKKFFYRYLDPAFSINNMPLNEFETNQLKSALDILQSYLCLSKNTEKFYFKQRMISLFPLHLKQTPFSICLN